MSAMSKLDLDTNPQHDFIVIQDSHNLWHWRAVDVNGKTLYTSEHSWINKDDAIMVGQSYGHNYIGDSQS